MQRLNRIASFGAFSLLLITGCDEQATSPGVATRDTAALLQTDSLAYTLRPTSVGYQAEIGVTLTNRTTGTIFIVNCGGATGVQLEKRVGIAWQGVWSPVIPLCLSPPITVPIGSTYRTRISIFGGYPGTNAYPQFSVADVTGEYRAIWGSVLSTYQDWLPFGDPLPVEWRTSNRFTLTAEPR
ncbi:MAG: hypothetical protein H7247_11270 [Polaromonas sp.]|nr:hypothetical protein [Gemmatimonadaceae bacterium]